MPPFRVFISWSEARSLAVAERLRDWIPGVVPGAEPWLSKEDLRSGSQWLHELNSALSSTSYGLIVVTPENQLKPWLHFEAGAISKALPERRCCPVLVGMRKADLIAPLSQFQATAVDNEEDMWKLVKEISAVSNSERPVDEARVGKWFNAFWTDFRDSVAAVSKSIAPSVPAAQRSPSDVLEEVLATVRQLAIGLPNVHEQIAALERELISGRLIDPTASSWSTSTSYSAHISPSGFLFEHRPTLEDVTERLARIEAAVATALRPTSGLGPEIVA